MPNRVVQALFSFISKKVLSANFRLFRQREQSTSPGNLRGGREVSNRLLTSATTVLDFGVI